MPKPVLFDFSNASASEIVSAIHNKVTSVANLRSFRTRVGSSKKSDRIYPATREALNILKFQRQQAKDAKIINGILKPYTAELAKGRHVLDIIQPVLTAYRLFYASRGIGLMNDQILLLKILEAGGELESMTGRAVPDMTTSA